MSAKPASAIAALALFAVAPAAQAGVSDLNAALDDLRAWNTIVFGDLTTGPDTFGRAFVGGNLGGGATEFYINPKGQIAPGLVVVGDVTGGTVHLAGGGATIGGSVTGAGVEAQAGGTVLIDGSATGVKGSSGAEIYVGGSVTSLNPNGATTQVGGPGNPADGVQAGLITQRDQMQSDLQELSGYLAGLTATDTASIVMNSATFNVTSGAEVAVFDLASLDQLNSMNADPHFVLPSSVDTVVINVGGANVTNGFNFNGDDALAQKVIWNFYEATSLNFSRQMWGAILAPNAQAAISSEITGTGVFASLDQRAQMHTPGYGGGWEIPGVPEPASWGLMIVGFVGAGALLRRRRAASAA